MPTSPMTVRIDTQIKKQFDSLCRQFGMSSNTAINIFINQVVRNRNIPFQITAEVPDKELVRERAIAALNEAQKRAENSNEPEITLEEINEEIRQARLEMRQKELTAAAV